eukprot:10032197-Heterocapsa_arctica.AAC.1
MEGGNRHGLHAAGALLDGDGGSFPPRGSLIESDEPEGEVAGEARAGEGIGANGGQGSEGHGEAGEQVGGMRTPPRS